MSTGITIIVIALSLVGYGFYMGLTTGRMLGKAAALARSNARLARFRRTLLRQSTTVQVDEELLWALVRGMGYRIIHEEDEQPGERTH